MSFEEIFGSGKQAKPTPISPTAANWIKAFEDSVEAILRVRKVSRVEAEGVAFINTVNAFLDANRPNSDQNKCAHCGSSKRPNDVRPFGGGNRHSWVHNGCWPDWSARRREAAIAELTAMGIVKP